MTNRGRTRRPFFPLRGMLAIALVTAFISFSVGVIVGMNLDGTYHLGRRSVFMDMRSEAAKARAEGRNHFTLPDIQTVRFHTWTPRTVQIIFPKPGDITIAGAGDEGVRRVDAP